ncbi:MAG: hypothetical protein ABJA66_20495 [Actinomycetota bacterium]
MREELEDVKNYLAIEKIRFEEKLTVEFDVEMLAVSRRSAIKLKNRFT